MNKLETVLEHINTCFNAQKKYFIPLFKINCKEEPYHAGTAFGLAYQEKKYLITASHVLDKDENNECDSDNELFCFYKGDLIQVKSFNIINVSVIEENIKQVIDVAIIEPKGMSLDDLFGEFFSEKDIDLSELTTNKYIAACGFPSSKNKIRWNSNTLTHISYAYCGKSSPTETSNKAGYLSPVYFCFDILLKKIFTSEQSEIKAPKPHGISGGPVFVIHDFSNPLKLLKPKLRGIVIENSQDFQCIACVNIKVVINAIVENNKQLENA